MDSSSEGKGGQTSSSVNVSRPVSKSVKASHVIFPSSEGEFMEAKASTSTHGLLESDDVGEKKDQLSSNQNLETESCHKSPTVKFPWVPFPGCGTRGRPIRLVTNYYDLKSKLTHIYHYDIGIEEQREDKCGSSKQGDSYKPSLLENQQRVSKFVYFKVFEKFVDVLKQSGKMKKFEPIYDGGRNIFTASKLPFNDKYSCNVKVDFDGRQRLYLITLKPVKKVDKRNTINMCSLKDWKSYNSETMNEILMILNAIMNDRESKSSEIRLGRSFFSLSETNKQDVGEGLEIRKGYHQRVHFTAQGPAVVLNISAKVFHKAGPALDYISELLRRDLRRRHTTLQLYEVEKIEKALKGVRVYVTHQSFKRKYYINSVTKESAERLTMSIKGREMSVAEYFAKEYRRLQCPFLPCFQMRHTTRAVYLPFENCEIIEGQAKACRGDDLSNKVRNDLIRTTAIPPEQRFEAIQKLSKVLRQSSATKMKEFGTMLEMYPRKVKGRVLEAPKIRYGGGCVSASAYGSWEVRGEVLNSVRNEKWNVLSFIGFNHRLEDFVYHLHQKADSLGIHFGKLVGINIVDKNESTESVLRNTREAGITLSVVVIKKNDERYGEIKSIADCNLKLITQCMTEDLLYKVNPTILENICLKVNTKLGGINHELAHTPRVLSSRTLLIGADVAHSNYCQSIAAVVGGLDRSTSKFQASCRIQENQKKGRQSQEIILEFEEIMKTILRKYLDFNQGTFPERIICYRDGVSEGQFKAVRDHEVECMRKALKDVIGYEIPITFIVAHKRHQTRLLPEFFYDGIGKGKNVPPGTIVDSDITYPDCYDFFICSHLGAFGTSKPTRYTVLIDENEIAPDKLQELTYKLCFLSETSKKSISIPLPVDLADKAATRAKVYVDHHRGKRHEGNSTEVLYTSSDIPDSMRDCIVEMELEGKTMFFV